MQQQSLVSLRLACDCSRAEAGSLNGLPTRWKTWSFLWKAECSQGVYQQEDVARDKFTIRIDLTWRESCKAAACVDVPPIPVAICAAASEHYIGGNNDCSIRALRCCSVFWSHDRCITLTFGWSCGASTRSRSTSIIWTATLWASCECRSLWLWHMQVTWHTVICSMISEMSAAFVKSITLTMKHLLYRGMWALDVHSITPWCLRVRDATFKALR